jgi:hypothetical protein
MVSLARPSLPYSPGGISTDSRRWSSGSILSAFRSVSYIERTYDYHCTRIKKSDNVSPTFAIAEQASVQVQSGVQR